MLSISGTGCLLYCFHVSLWSTFDLPRFLKRELQLRVCHANDFFIFSFFYCIIYPVHAVLTCGGQRAAFGSWFYPSSMWTLGWNADPRAWQQVLSPLNLLTS